MTTLAEIFSACVGDETSLTTLPGGSRSRHAVWRYVHRRGDEARAILLDELRRGRVDYAGCVAENEAIPIVLRYIRAAQEGTSRLTLRLLAQLIAGQAKNGRLVSADFLGYADTLASLTREEIVVIGSMYQSWATRATANGRIATKVLDPWLATKRDLTAKGWPEDYLIARCANGQRIGLLIPVNVVGETGFRLSPLMIELGKTIDFDDALRREPTS